jgi:hypothetical protein
VKKLLLTTTIVVGALYFGPTANAAVTDIFCGPASGQGCELGGDAMVFLQSQTNPMHGLGNIGSQSGLPLMHFDSTGGMLDVFIDLANGFATIKPHNGISFNGLKITIPGFEFTGLVFDDQLTPNAAPKFTIDGRTGANDDGSTIEIEAANTDKEYAIRAVGGAFDEVDITSLTGFDEFKHFEVSGVCAIQSNGTCTPVIIETPEPAGLAVLGVGLLGLGYVVNRRRNGVGIVF